MGTTKCPLYKMRRKMAAQKTVVSNNAEFSGAARRADSA